MDLLGLPPNATAEQVKRSYLQAVKETHPDHSTDPQASEQVMELNDAWDIYRKQKWISRTTADSGSFTTFGVGCSFSDDPEEQRERAAVMEQASRGRINQRTLSGRPK